MPTETYCMDKNTTPITQYRQFIAEILDSAGYETDLGRFHAFVRNLLEQATAEQKLLFS
jgi:hypothetical protein